MARKQNRRVNSRSERTVEQYVIDGNTVRKIQAIPQEEPEVRPVRRTTSRNRARTRAMSRGYVMFLAVVSAAALFMCVRYLQMKSAITTQTKEIATAESELSQLKADNDALYNSVISSVDLEKIKDKAMNELGMTYPQEDQIYQFDTAGNSYVRQYKDVPDTTKYGGCVQRKRRKKRGNPLLTRKINSKMRMKLVWLFGMVVLAFVGLGIRITVINASQGNQYSKQVLSQSQQKYDSRVIPFKRGDITDRNGVVLATSEKVYKVILDCKVVNTKEEYVEPTIKALVDVMGLDEETVRKKLEDETTKDSQYQILQSNVSINQKKAFEDYTDVSGEEAKEKLTKEEIAERSNIKGVWFEEDYRRVYPLNSTASHLVGFTYTGNSADWGIEGYYSSTLNGVNGRQFGYYNSDADVEQNIIDPINGNSVESTIDLNIQQVVEKYISNFMDGMANGPRGAEGAANVGVIVANPKNGEILAMATDNPYDLNNPRDLTSY